MTTLILTLVLIGLFFVGMSVRLLLIKNGEFKGTCASQSPFLNKEGENCGFCGASPDEMCKKEEVAS